MRTNRIEKIKKMCISAVFIALAFVVTLVFHIKVLFLTFDLKDAVMLIGAMICGPVYAVVMPVITALLEFMSPVSDTGIYGLIMNILSSVAFSLPACLVYNYKKSIKSALLGITTAVFTTTAVMLLANLIVTPYYYHMTVSGVAQMIPTLLLPFNLTKAALNAGFVLLLYKPMIQTLRKAKLVDLSNEKSEEKKSKIRSSVLMSLLALALIAVSLCVFFLVLGGKISFGIK